MEHEELFCCTVDELLNLPPPRRDWQPLQGDQNEIEWDERIRAEKAHAWNLPSDIRTALKGIIDSRWWIINHFAEDASSILWPKSWKRIRVTPQDFTTEEASQVFRPLLRKAVAPVRQEYRDRHWRCERCHEAAPREGWLVKPTWSAFCAQVEAALGADGVVQLVIAPDWPDAIKSELITSYRSQAQHVALCRSCAWD